MRDTRDDDSGNERAARRHLGQLGGDILQAWVSGADRQPQIRVEEMMCREYGAQGSKMLDLVVPREHIWAVCPPDHGLRSRVQNHQEFALARQSRGFQYAN